MALVHGDWRIDNMIFAPNAPRLIAVLDWELSTLGHPFADLAYQCMQWRFPNSGSFRGLGGVDRGLQGLPTNPNMSPPIAAARVLRASRIGRFSSLSVFSAASPIVQGVYKRALDGNASNPERAQQMGKAVPMMARLAAEAVETGA